MKLNPKRIAWLAAAPIGALVFVLTRPTSLPGDRRPDEAPSLATPPDAACEASFLSSLESMQGGVTSVEAVRTSARLAPAAELQDNIAGASADEDWQALRRRTSFVDAFLGAPPGVALRELHRCRDLNPDDKYLSPDVREAIERAIEPYYRSLETSRIERDRRFADDMGAAKLAGLAKVEHVPTTAGEPISVTLQPTPIRTLSSIEVDEAGLVESATVDVGAMRGYAYMDSLHWYIAREAGIQIVSLYVAFNLVSSSNGESMTRRLVESCERRTH